MQVKPPAEEVFRWDSDEEGKDGKNTVNDS
jgi:hypothetical protein